MAVSRRRVSAGAVITALLGGTLAVAPPSGAVAPAAATEDAGDGYWMVSADGVVSTFGEASFCGNAPNAFRDPFWPPGTPPMLSTVDIAPFSDNSGYWILDRSGGAHVRSCVPVPRTTHYLIPDAVAVMAEPGTTGFWVVDARGVVHTWDATGFFGDFRSGALAGVQLNAPIVDAVATPTGRGYYLLGADGGIFTFGDAQFAGSMGGKRLNAPIVSMAADPDGRGYWLVAADGGVFSFDAHFYGSMGAVRLNEPVVGMVASPRGSGYLMVAQDGGVFTFGDVPFHGSLGATPPEYPIVAIAAMN